MGNNSGIYQLVANGPVYASPCRKPIFNKKVGFYRVQCVNQF